MHAEPRLPDSPRPGPLPAAPPLDGPDRARLLEPPVGRPDRAVVPDAARRPRAVGEPGPPRRRALRVRKVGHSSSSASWRSSGTAPLLRRRARSPAPSSSRRPTAGWTSSGRGSTRAGCPPWATWPWTRSARCSGSRPGRSRAAPRRGAPGRRLGGGRPRRAQRPGDRLDVALGRPAVDAGVAALGLGLVAAGWLGRGARQGRGATARRCAPPGTRPRRAAGRGALRRGARGGRPPRCAACAGTCRRAGPP